MAGPGYVWCADCNGLGTIDASDDDFPEEIDCPRCDGNGEHPADDWNDDFDGDGLDWSEGMG